MTQVRSSAVLLAVAGLLAVEDAGAQISSEFRRIDCTGYALDVTDVRVALNVTDEASGASRSYLNPLGRPFAPVQDTEAFPCP